MRTRPLVLEQTNSSHTAPEAWCLGCTFLYVVYRHDDAILLVCYTKESRNSSRRGQILINKLIQHYLYTDFRANLGHIIFQAENLLNHFSIKIFMSKMSSRAAFQKNAIEKKSGGTKFVRRRKFLERGSFGSNFNQSGRMFGAENETICHEKF